MHFEKTLIIFLFSLLLAFSKPAPAEEVSREQCKNIDYSARFGPVRDQDGHGFCWAFAASALVEESLCKKDPALCGKSISPLDLSSCNWKLLEKQEANLPEEGLRCAMYRGVCFEELAPYDNLISKGCSLWDLISSTSQSPHCKNNKLANLYKKWKDAEVACTNPAPYIPKSYMSLDDIKTDLIRQLRETVPEQALLGKDAAALFSAKSQADFLKNTLISKNCEQNRNKIQARSITYIPAPSENPLVRVAEQLRRGRSSVVYVNLSKALRFFSSSGFEENLSHAIVINGMRYNEEKKTCEFNLRNSWGEDAELHGWYPADKIEKSIVAMAHLE